MAALPGCPRARERPSRPSTCGSSCARRCSSGAARARADALAGSGGDGEKLGDEQRLGARLHLPVNYHYLKGEPDLAIEYGERCLRIGDAAGTWRCRRWRAAIWATAVTPRDGIRRASSMLRQNVEALEMVPGDAPGGQTGISYVTSSGWLAFTLADLGEFDAAADVARPGAAGGRGERARLHPDHRADPGRARLAAARPARAGAPLAPAEPRRLPREGPRRVAADPVVAARAHAVLLGRVEEGLRAARGRRDPHRGAGRPRLSRRSGPRNLAEGLPAAGQLDRARDRGAAGARARPPAQGARPSGVGAAPPRRRRRLAEPPRSARPKATTAGARAGRGARDAPAAGPHATWGWAGCCAWPATGSGRRITWRPPSAAARDGHAVLALAGRRGAPAPRPALHRRAPRIQLYDYLQARVRGRAGHRHPGPAAWAAAGERGGRPTASAGRPSAAARSRSTTPSARAGFAVVPEIIGGA